MWHLGRSDLRSGRWRTNCTGRSWTGTTTHARDLPWRGPGATPWSVMVSEFMLQQTPVARVLPVHEAWLERWPTPVPSLAADRAGEAVRTWGRLGYPRRALRLHAAASAIVDRARRRGPGRLRRPAGAARRR